MAVVGHMSEVDPFCCYRYLGKQARDRLRVVIAVKRNIAGLQERGLRIEEIEASSMVLLKRLQAVCVELPLAQQRCYLTYILWLIDRLQHCRQQAVRPACDQWRGVAQRCQFVRVSQALANADLIVAPVASDDPNPGFSPQIETQGCCHRSSSNQSPLTSASPFSITNPSSLSRRRRRLLRVILCVCTSNGSGCSPRSGRRNYTPGPA
jgi:hypothetical protein